MAQMLPPIGILHDTAEDKVLLGHSLLQLWK